MANVNICDVFKAYNNTPLHEGIVLADYTMETTNTEFDDTVTAHYCIPCFHARMERIKTGELTKGRTVFISCCR